MMKNQLMLTLDFVIMISLLLAKSAAFSVPPSHSLLPRQFHAPPPIRQNQQLSMIPPQLSSVGGSLSVLCFVVLIHEAGHYLAARSFGMKVSEFSIGVGPKLLGFEAWGNDFSLRAFPLGGYVRFPENYNSTLMQQREKEEEEANDYYSNGGRDINGNPEFVAGLLNIITLGQYEKSIKEKLQDEEAKLIKQEQGQPWYKRAFMTRKKQEPTTPPSSEIEYYDDPDLLQNRPWQQRAVVIAGGVVFNLLLAFSIYFGEITTVGLSQPTFGNGAIVASTPRPGTSAAAGILREGDLIIKVNGQSLSKTGDIMNGAMAQQSITDFISKIRATTVDESLTLAVVRSQTTMEVTIQPTQMSPSGPKTIGVMLKPNFVKSKLIQTTNLKDATVLAATSVKEITVATAQGVAGLLGSVGKGALPAGQGISGPVGLIKTGSEVVSSNDLATIMIFAAAISVNLAVINSLPLPALDGGQMAFILFEAISGRKVDQRVQETITGVTVLLLLLLTVGTTFSDVSSILK